jgi:LCP family protein required for cell wall assembly
MDPQNLKIIQKMRSYNRPTAGQFNLVAVGLVLALAAFLFSTKFVACWELTALPGVVPPVCSFQPKPTDIHQSKTPGLATAFTSTPGIPQAQLPSPWDGASRVTILVIGLDYRDWVAGQGAPRSDTMMLLTFDPLSKTAALLSIPRDLWVNIPGLGYSRINSAYAYGEGYKLPGGGPGLAMRTVEDFLGIPIQYYVQLDFQSFEKLVDTIGGIDVNIPAEIVVDPLGPGNTVTLQPGLQHLNGAVALGYARNRHTENGDVDRAGRQQQVALAIRAKVLAPENFLKWMAEAPALYSELSAGVKTNLSLNDALELAMAVKDVPFNSIQTKVIDFTMEQERIIHINGQEADILQPYPDKIRELVDQIFGSGSMQPLAAGSDEQLMQADEASVLVVNASDVNGIASKTAEYLKSLGVSTVSFGDTSQYPDKYRYPPLPGRTMIIVHAGKLYTMKYLEMLFNLDSNNQLLISFNPDAAADITVAVGTDWAHHNPMP